MTPTTLQTSVSQNVSLSASNHAAQTIAIVGGGLSGTLVAVHLLRNATQPLTIKLIERRSTIGCGVAYSTGMDCHLLNVPAGKMSAFADDPDHFLRWIHTKAAIGSITPVTFVPRRLYGQYIQAVLQAAEATASPQVQLERIQEEVIALKTGSSQVMLGLSRGDWMAVDRVVLALGNFPPGDPPVADPAFYESYRYIGSPWSSAALTNLMPDDPVLLIGSGLTMLDLAVALHQKGHRGSIRAVSRRGLLPQPHLSQPHKSTSPYPAFLSVDQAPKTVRSLLKRIRQEVETAVAQGYDWRSVMDALRPETSALWQNLPLKEQQRFLRHGRAFWEVHRHRVAPTIATLITQLQATQQLQVYAGRIQAYQEDAAGVDVSVRLRGQGETIGLRASYVINCTGPECNYRKFRHPLIQDLLESGLIRPDPLKLGLEVAANGALIDTMGQPSQQLYTIGAPQKGLLWETTAVPEIRVQARRLAESLLERVSQYISEESTIEGGKQEEACLSLRVNTEITSEKTRF